MRILRAYEPENAQANLISKGLLNANQKIKLDLGDARLLLQFRRFDILHVHGASAAASRISEWSPYLGNPTTACLIQYDTEEIRSRPDAARSNFYAHLAGDYIDGAGGLLQQLSSVFPACIVNNQEAAEYAAKYHRRVHIVPYAIDPKELEKLPDTSSRSYGGPLVIAHIDKESNGSEFVEKAISQLQSDGYSIEYLPIQSLDHADAASLIKRANIVVDQLLHGTYGMVTAMAMALGKPVISHIREDLKPVMSPELPVISANPATLYRELIPLIKNKVWRDRLGNAGRAYAEKNHYIDAVTPRILEIFRTELELKSDSANRDG